jgi:hypothetical protein
MNVVVAIYAAILFFVLSPGILLSLPPKGSKMMVAATHAVVFAVVLYFTQKMVWRASMMMTMPSKEGMNDKKGESKQ